MIYSLGHRFVFGFLTIIQEKSSGVELAWVKILALPLSKLGEMKLGLTA